MKILDLATDEYESIPITTTGCRIYIEVAATRRIDFGVIDDNALTAFENDKSFDKIEWYPNQKGPKEFSVELPESDTKYWLLLWNANEEKKAAVAYRFSAIPSA